MPIDPRLFADAISELIILGGIAFPELLERHSPEVRRRLAAETLLADAHSRRGAHRSDPGRLS